MPTDNRILYLAPARGESILVMTDLVTVKLNGDNSGGAFVLTEVSTPPHGGPPMLHRHLDRETFYVLEGQVRFDTIEDDQATSIEATCGAVVHIPSMLWHNYKNVGTVRSKMIVVLQPGDMLDFFRELGVPVTDPSNLPHPSGPPDMNRILAIMQKHHVELFQPTKTNV